MTHDKSRPDARPLPRHSVPLDTLPDPFPIPADLTSRFGYDPARKGLTFDGFMCKAIYDRLREVSQDYHYQRALEQLFDICVPEEDASRRGYGLLVAAGLVVVVAALVAVWAVFR